MDSSLVRGSVWIVAALVAVLAIGWAGTGGCAGAGSAQLRSEVDDLASRVQALDARVRKLEGGSKARTAKAKGGKGSKLAGGGKAKGKGAADGTKAKAGTLAKSPAKAKAGKAAAPPVTDQATEGEIPPG